MIVMKLTWSHIYFRRSYEPEEISRLSSVVQLEFNSYKQKLKRVAVAVLT